VDGIPGELIIGRLDKRYTPPHCWEVTSSCESDKLDTKETLM